MRKRALAAAIVLLFAAMVLAQSQGVPPKSILGTVTAIDFGIQEVEVKPDSGDPVSLKPTSTTAVQRVAPGQTDLKNAAAINISDVQKGDRVLVTLAPNTSDIVRIVVMSASDIAKRDQADQQDWMRRGISGIVAKKNGNQIIFRIRQPQSEVEQIVAVTDKTVFRRYSADSVKFSDAKLSKLEEVSVGDQLRARGTKTADGMKVDAEEVVFGTFLTKGGSVVSVDIAGRQVTAKEVGTGKTFIIKLTSDSRIKQMSGTSAGAGGGSVPAAARPAAAGAIGPGDRGGPPNLAEMIENLPAGKLDDIRPGSSVVVSSTKGAQIDQVTAILLVTNADLLIQMATSSSSRGGVLTFGTGGGGVGLGVLNINP